MDAYLYFSIQGNPGGASGVSHFVMDMKLCADARLVNWYAMEVVDVSDRNMVLVSTSKSTKLQIEILLCFIYIISVIYLYFGRGRLRKFPKHSHSYRNNIPNPAEMA